MSNAAAAAASAYGAFFEQVQSRTEAMMAFRSYDTDNSGTLSVHELRLAARSLGVAISDQDAAAVVERIGGGGGGGAVSINEFLDEVWRGKLEAVRRKFETSSCVLGRQVALPTRWPGG